MTKSPWSPRKANIKRCHCTAVVKGCLNDNLALVSSPEVACRFRYDPNHCEKSVYFTFDLAIYYSSTKNSLFQTKTRATSYILSDFHPISKQASKHRWHTKRNIMGRYKWNWIVETPPLYFDSRSYNGCPAAIRLQTRQITRFLISDLNQIWELLQLRKKGVVAWGNGW